MREFTLDEQTAISHAYDRGNYANAYESTDLDDHDLDPLPKHERAAFVLGFFSSYALAEIGCGDREIFDESYFSDAGRYVVGVGLDVVDDRADEYAAEESEMSE